MIFAVFIFYPLHFTFRPRMRVYSSVNMTIHQISENRRKKGKCQPESAASSRMPVPVILDDPKVISIPDLIRDIFEIRNSKYPEYFWRRKHVGEQCNSSQGSLPEIRFPEGRLLVEGKGCLLRKRDSALGKGEKRTNEPGRKCR